MISSYVGENAEFMRQFLSGELEVEFNPQGTLAERMRAGGAGIPGFYTPTGVGTVVAEGKEHREFDGETYILERGIDADLAIVKAWKGDSTATSSIAGPRATSTRTSPPAAGSRRRGREISSSSASSTRTSIHTPGIFVHRIVQGPHEKRIEQRTVRASLTEGTRHHALDTRQDGRAAPPGARRTAST